MIRFAPRPALSLLAFALVTGLLFAAGPAPAVEFATDVVGPNILVRITPATKAEFVELRDAGLDVIHIHGGRFEILLSEEQLRELEGRGFVVEIVNPDMYANLRALKLARGSLIGNYTTYDEMAARMQDRATTYPTLASVQSLGLSHESRDIWALKISDNVAVDENEPEVLYMGTYHARELITVEINLALADSLLMNYGTDSRITDWVNEREIWFVPMVNPDGHVFVETNNTNWRKNRSHNGAGSRGVDLNRNHSYEWGHDDNGSDPSIWSETYRGPSPASEEETQVIQSFVDSRQFVFSHSFHSYGNLWLWGPGWEPAYGPDQDVFAGYGARVNALNGYRPGGPAGAGIYVTNGSSDDWLYGSPSHAKVFAMTPEVGTSSDGFYPPESRIPALVAENIEPAFLALEFADDPTRLAPPGPPAMTSDTPVSSGDFEVSWDAPTVGDTQVVEYELTEKTGPSVVTEGAESGTGDWNLDSWTRSSSRAATGSWSLYSGSGDELNRICLAKEGYLVQPGDAFTFQAWYDIEDGWDYAYAVLSPDGGRSIVSLPGTGTTMTDPNGNNAGHGITGSSGGWQAMSYDLSPWVGQTVRLGFRYWSDGGVANEGFYADDIHPVQRWATSAVLSSAIAGTTFPVTGRAAGAYWYTARGRDAEGDWGYPAADAPVVVDPSTDILPGLAATGLSLAAAAPNPFSGSTLIRFGLSRAGSHSLDVYDVSGRKVRTLSRGTLAAGRHEVVWDGRSDDGSAMTSGVYFYRLSAVGGELERRAVLRR